MKKTTKVAPKNPAVFARVDEATVARLDRVVERLRLTNSMAGRSDAIREALNAGLAAMEAKKV